MQERAKLEAECYDAFVVMNVIKQTGWDCASSYVDTIHLLARYVE